MNLQLRSVKTLQNLYGDFKNSPNLSPTEYINQTIPLTQLSDTEITLFLQICKHRRFLETLCGTLLKDWHLKDFTQEEIKVFLLLFVLDESNTEEILQYFIQTDRDYVEDLIAAIADHANHLFLCKTACMYFSDDYVLTQILDRLLNNIPIILKLGKRYLKLHEQKQMPPTNPKPFSMLKSPYRRNPPPPSNTPAVRQGFRATRVPDTTYVSQIWFNKKIAKSKAQNRKKAEELILQAAQVSDRLFKSRNVLKSDDLMQETFKSKPPPTFKPVEVKGNVTTTLREASRLVKVQQDETKKVEELIKGGHSSDKYDEIVEAIKKENELKQMEIIERNHLKGLLSREEAILAKRKLLEDTKAKMEKFKRDKLEVLRALDVWKEQEQEKCRLLVEKSQTIKQNAKNSEKKMLEKKQEAVRLMQQEIRTMLEHAMIEKNRELAKKMELIEEIKALHRVRCNIKEFDPTETPNLGLLCEMSIAELQERLAIAKMNMHKELEEKRQGILRMKEDHKLMMENVKKIIIECRAIRKREQKSTEKSELKTCFLNPELVELRKQLEEKRRLRCSLQL